MAAKKKDGPKIVMRTLAVKLSPEERLTRTTELLESMQRKDALVMLKSEQTANINAEIKLAAQEVKNLSSVIREGTEKREVPCAEIHNFANNTVQVERSDTKEIVEERAMAFDERQAQLPGVDKPIAIPPTKPGKGSGAPIATLGEHVAARAARLVEERHAAKRGTEIDDPATLLDAIPKAAAPAAKRKPGRPRKGG